MAKTFSFGPEPKDWGVTVNQHYRELRDSTGVPTMQIPTDREIKMEWRGMPVTLDEDHRGNFNIAIWMPGEANRSPPLLGEVFNGRQFHELTQRAMDSASRYWRGFGSGGLGPREAFIVQWAESNHSAISENFIKRRQQGELYDRSYDWIRNEETDPALMEASMEARPEYKRTLELALEAERREKAEAAERARIARERRQREQEELEALPGYGSF